MPATGADRGRRDGPSDGASSTRLHGAGLTLDEVNSLCAAVLDRDHAGRLQWPRLARCEREAINRASWRAGRARWQLRAEVLTLRWVAARRADPHLDIVEFLNRAQSA